MLYFGPRPTMMPSSHPAPKITPCSIPHRRWKQGSDRVLQIYSDRRATTTQLPPPRLRRCTTFELRFRTVNQPHASAVAAADAKYAVILAQPLGGNTSPTFEGVCRRRRSVTSGRVSDPRFR